MKPIEKEAEVYATKLCENTGTDLQNSYQKESNILCYKIHFVAGAKSKTVDEMLLRAIELARKKWYVNGISKTTEDMEVEKIFTTKEILEKVKQ